MALALAAVGLYGLTAFLVAQRSREIGVRMALGASARDVLRLVVSQGAKLTAAGLTMGLALGLVLVSRNVQRPFFGVRAWDPWTLAGTLLTLGTAAVLAHWAPAHRAARVNPIDALRHDQQEDSLAASLPFRTQPRWSRSAPGRLESVALWERRPESSSPWSPEKRRP